MSVAHSKSAIPAEVLNDRIALRRVLQRVVFTSLDDHRAGKHLPQAADTSPIPADANTDAYDDPSQSFAWLTAPSGPQAELADDVVDVAAGAARGGRVATTRHGPPHVGWVRDLHGRRDGTRRLYAAARER